MVKAAAFVRGMSEILAVEERTLASIFRALRSERLISTGARGVNAPEMTCLDAARLTIAAMVSESQARAAEASREFGGLACGEQGSPEKIALMKRIREHRRQQTHEPEPDAEFRFETIGLAQAHSFEEAIAALLRVYSEDFDQPYFLNAIPKPNPLFDLGPAIMKISGIDLRLPKTDVEVDITNLTGTINMSGNVRWYNRPIGLDGDEDIGVLIERRRLFASAISRTSTINALSLRRIGVFVHSEAEAMLNGWVTRLQDGKED